MERQELLEGSPLNADSHVGIRHSCFFSASSCMSISMATRSRGRLMKAIRRRPQDWGLWREAAPVNEALAARVHINMARDLPELVDKVRGYVNRGDCMGRALSRRRCDQTRRCPRRAGAGSSTCQNPGSDPPAAVAWMCNEIANSEATSPPAI